MISWASPSEESDFIILANSWSLLPELLMRRAKFLCGCSVNIHVRGFGRFLEIYVNRHSCGSPVSFWVVFSDVSNNNLGGQLPDNIGSLQDIQSL